MNNSYKSDFPILAEYPNLAYLDSAATTQKPDVVIEAIDTYYKKKNANPLRGLYDLSIKATEEVENARMEMAKFIHANHAEEIIFTRNTTESLNLIAYSYSKIALQSGDEILVSILEHHSNLVPWQQAAKKYGAILKFVYTDEEGNISLEEIKSKITPKTKIVAITMVSNVLGCETPIKEITSLAHHAGAVVVADGAQAAAHIPVNVKELDIDFFVCSGHKMFAPMGIGILYGKKHLLDAMPPFLTGGEMIQSVHEQSATFAPLPQKFEAGTVNAEGAAGLYRALLYIEEIGFDKIMAIEEDLTALCMEELTKLPYVTIIGSKNPKKHLGVISFLVDGIHPHDVSSVLDMGNVAIRAGHHCAQPLLEYLHIDSCCRVSFSIYNDKEDVIHFINQLKEVKRWFDGTQ